MNKIDKKLKFKDNPRKINADQQQRLRAHLEELGDLSGVVYCRNNKAYVGGNQRSDIFHGAKVTITDELPQADKQGTIAHGFIEWNDGKYAYREVKFTEEQFRKACIVANNDGGEWDYTELQTWDIDELQEWGFVMPDEFKENEKVIDFGEEPDIIPEVKTDIQIGDLFKIGDHFLMCGDSCDSDQVSRLMQGKQCDMFFTDPDFSMSFDLLFQAYANLKLFSKTGFGFVIAGDKQAVQLANYDFENFAHFFIQDVKAATLTSNSMAMTRHVMICKFGNRKMNNLKDGFTTIIDVASARMLKNHKELPMQKRPELPAKFIEHYTDKGGIVLDLFGHSGSTMIACQELGRVCYMQELSPSYCQQIINRMKEKYNISAEIVAKTIDNQ